MISHSLDPKCFISNDDYEILTPDGWKNFSGIAIYEKKESCKITTNSNKTIIVSNKHQFSGEYDDIYADESLGFNILTKDGYELVIGVTPVEDTEMYDVVNVEDVHKFYGNDIVNHNTHIVEEFWKSVYPTISRSKTSKILAASTPNGKGNLFHRLYTDAVNGENGFNALKIGWDEIPGRDEEWKKEQIRELGSLESFLQEFGNEFLDTGETAIDAELFEELKKNCKEPKHVLDEGHYKIWEDPDSSRIYVAGVDVSEGVNQDASVIEILDITDPKEIVQVAEYWNNKIAPAEFSNKLYEILQNWGNPLVLIERNNQGGQVCDRLAIDFGYEKVVSWGAKQSHRMNEQHGIISHTNTKHRAVLNERYFINEVRVVKFNSIATLNEFKTFIRYPNGTWKAKGGEHDDRVMAFLWALMILHNEITQLYFEIVEVDDFGKPLVLSPIEWGTKMFTNPTSIYTNEQVEKIENSNLSPMSFGAFGEADDEFSQLLADGWQLLNRDVPYIHPDRNMTRESMEIMDRWFG